MTTMSERPENMRQKRTEGMGWTVEVKKMTSV